MIFHTEEIKKTIPSNVVIVAATKYFTPTEMKKLYNTGITNFGENRVEAFVEKYEALQDLDVTWHFIGTLQTKKVKKVVNKIDVLHSLNTLKLAQELDKRREKVLPCFIQVNISDEENKHGFNVDEVIPFIEELRSLSNIKVIGLMGMAELTKDDDIVHSEFNKLNTLQKEIKETLNMDIDYLSIGMSNDYKIALQHNATHLRLGSILYTKEVE
jgi:hypothetical protein